MRVGGEGGVKGDTDRQHEEMRVGGEGGVKGIQTDRQ